MLVKAWWGRGHVEAVCQHTDREHISAMYFNRFHYHVTTYDIVDNNPGIRIYHLV